MNLIMMSVYMNRAFIQNWSTDVQSCKLSLKKQKKVLHKPPFIHFDQADCIFIPITYFHVTIPHVYVYLKCPVLLVFLFVPVCLTEGMWLSPGFADCVCNAGRVLHYGLAMVRGCNRPLYFPRQQPEGGVRLLSTWGAAQVSGHSGAASHRVHDFCSHGLLRFHDISTKGKKEIICYHQLRIFRHYFCFVKMPRKLKITYLRLFFFSLSVHSNACSVRSLSLHGCLFPQRHSSKSLLCLPLKIINHVNQSRTAVMSCY